MALAYDTARVAIHGIAKARIPTPKEVELGLERVRWMPDTNGGPATCVQFGPGDHKGYQGDFLTIWELRDRELRFVEYVRPPWPANRMPIPDYGDRADTPSSPGSLVSRHGGRAGGSR